MCEDAGIHAKFPQSPQEMELLASFLDHSVCVYCPGEVLSDAQAKELEATDRFNLTVTDVGGGCPPLCCLL